MVDGDVLLPRECCRVRQHILVKEQCSCQIPANRRPPPMNELTEATIRKNAH
jgi:hypothetical protein